MVLDVKYECMQSEKNVRVDPPLVFFKLDNFNSDDDEQYYRLQLPAKGIFLLHDMITVKLFQKKSCKINRRCWSLEIPT